MEQNFNAETNINSELNINSEINTNSELNIKSEIKSNAAPKVKIDQFLDEAGRVTQWPSKHKYKLAVLEYISGKFDSNCTYTEHQVNEICQQWHTFNDFFLVRRELVGNGYMGRERNGSRYWKN